MVEEKISQEFRLKNIDETRNYLLEEIEKNEFMSRKHKNVCTTLNYNEHFVIFSFLSYWMFFNSAFASLLGIPIAIRSSSIGLEICAIVSGIKMYKPIIKKKKKKHDKIVLLAKTNLNSIEVLDSKALIDSNISYDELVLINNQVKQYDDIKEEIKKFKDLNSLSKILVYIYNNVIVLFEV